MLESVTNDLSFLDLTQEEKERRGILGRLFGPIASFRFGTRNGRKYSDTLWEKVFQNNIVRELLKNGGIPGELDHPADREETCSEKIAVMMPEQPKKDKDGHLVGYFDILDTPNGRIAYALSKYGFKFGVSSRGSGDVTQDYDGTESVDPNTYTLNAWDLVLIPACEDARMAFRESLDSSKLNLRRELCESLKNASEDDRKVMTETLNNLKIDYLSEGTNNTATTETDEADNDGADVIKELQESLKENKKLEKQVAELQEKLSVCYAKEAENEEIEAKYQKSTSALAESVKTTDALKKRVALLVEQEKKKTSTIESLRKSLRALQESQSSSIQSKKKLLESVENGKSEVNKLTEEIKSLKESIESEKTKSESEKNALEEKIADLEKDCALKESECSRRIDRERELVEKYKKVASIATNKYIECQARRLGVPAITIREKLGKTSSFAEIDSVCESMQNYVTVSSKLPFDTSKKVRMKITESKESIVPDSRFDDTVDESLLSLAKQS